ncbi:hypothetical protein Q9L58_008373 [Maublancomyces gigas]|uniref:Xylanolytic transcriptional activator regulatory domain-containing protein n=1 Tax=Discina gigas TaxID=1032678 RepID=A0ABR3GAM9_9PEZI
MLPQDPISQDVGLLSLSAIEEPKYIGSSSGISFIRLVLQDGQEPDFRPVEYQSRDVKPTFGGGGGGVRHWPGINAEPALLPKLEECGLLAGIYFTNVSSQYPFLNRPQFEACLEAVHQADNGAAYQLPQGYSMAVARFQVFLVLSISANILSSRMGHHMDSEGYFASAMRCVDNITLTGSVQAAQSALLLAMRSLYATGGGLNLWYLNAIIMATCVDLGLQRKITSFDQNQSAMKRRVFWCAYVLDRNLGISLGRPFSLRDEAFDTEFPDEGDNDEELAHPNAFSIGGGSSSNVVTARASFSGSIYLFRMTKILSNIKITIHRVVQPSVGKWQVDLSDWQAGILRQLTELRDQARSALGASRRLSGTGGIRLGSGHMVELKFYEAIQLLFRPSPAFPRPNSFGFQQCFNAATETIRIYANLKLYGELQYTWLTAQSIFHSGITMLDAYRYCREIQAQATNEVLLEDIKSCSSLLENLGTKWPIAKFSKANFDTRAHPIILLVTNNSSRMLSPHDGPRRASSSSQGRHFSEFQKLEVPNMSHHAAAQQTQPQLGSTPSNWYADPTAGTSSNSGAGVPMDTSWMGTINWETQGDLLISNGGTGFEGMDPNDNSILSFLAPASGVGSGGDTSMWDMEQGEHDTRH